ncbi:MAG: helix-turn-helix transcriptional regulator [Phycisphaerae bacterium]|nr:helix-turn-helix transcriptional regulator [Phycisphaerae bacterium]
MKHEGLRKPTQELVRVLAENVRSLRHAKGLSQEELAAVCGLHRTYVGSVERGERNVTLSTLEVLASALGVTAPSLLMASRTSADQSAERPGRPRGT